MTILYSITNIWFLTSTKANGTEYYQCVLLYVGYILDIMEKPTYFIRNELGHRFVIKPSSIGPPNQYLGNKVSLLTLDNYLQPWSFSSSNYVQNAVNNVAGKLSCEGRSLPKRDLSPWTSNYRPDTDITPELSRILT